MTQLTITSSLAALIFAFFVNANLAFGQTKTENVLNNNGKICAVIYGGENITVNNNLQFHFPEEQIKNLDKKIETFLQTHNALSEKERKIYEKELNIDRRIKNFEDRISKYITKLNFVSNLLPSLDSNSIIKNEELIELRQLLCLASAATFGAQCLINDDYTFEVIKDGNGGYLHRIEKKILDGDPNYMLVYQFKNGIARIKQYEKYGFINSSGEIIVPLKYDTAEDFSEERALVGTETSKGMVYFFVDDKNNKIGAELLEGQSFKHGVAWAKVKKKAGEKNDLGLSWGGSPIKQVLLNKLGKILKIANNKYALYDSLYQIENELWVSLNKERKGLLSKEGSLIHLPKFKNINALSNGYRSIQCMDGTWGYLNESHELYLRCLYSSAENFSNERAIISITNDDGQLTYGLINKEGGKVIKPIFTKISRINTSKYQVFISEEKFILNQYGYCLGSTSEKRKFKNLFLKNK